MRKHPTTGECTMQQGTHVGAPSGAPIWAASTGTAVLDGLAARLDA